MGAFKDESVVVHRGKHEGDPSEITVNCPDKVGLGCDLARTVFEFGLSVVKGGDDFLLIVLFQTIQTTDILLEFEKNSFHLPEDLHSSKKGHNNMSLLFFIQCSSCRQATNNTCGELFSCCIVW
jgi:hypothetical protein